MKTASRAGPDGPAARTRLKLVLLPGLVLALGLSMTYGLWQTTREGAARAMQEDLRLAASTISSRIEDRVRDYVQVLRGVVGLFNASTSVDRQEFHRYVASLGLTQRYPGIQAIGFCEFIPADRKAEHIAAVRREGFRDYDIRPAGQRDFYTAVVYIEPFGGPNLRDFGYDMAPDPVRWAAAAQARDLAQAAFSGKVALQQNDRSDTQSGFLLFLPIYRPGGPHGTLEARRSGLIGWAYSAVRMHALIEDVLNTVEIDKLPPTLQVEIHDGSRQTPATLLFALGHAATGAASDPLYRQVRRLDLSGRQWSLALSSNSRPEDWRPNDKATQVALVGVTASLLLALFVGAQTLSQMRIASLLTKTARANDRLAEREQDLLWAQRIAQLGSWHHDPVSQQTLWSDGMFSIWGLDPRQGAPDAKRHRKLIHPEDRQLLDKAMRAAVERGAPYSLELRIRRPDGETRTIMTICTPQSDAAGRVLRLSGTDQDITDRVQLQEALREQAIRDPLTGLLNRRFLDETLPRELARCQRTGESLVVAMLDLDRFKGLNDTYGHEAGDQVLRAVGALLRGSVRSADLACRYGGEELTLILPGTTLEDARVRLDALRESISQIRVRYREGELPAITVSVGLAAAARNETDAAALVSRADTALYRAKAQGRNRVRVAAS
jgi:diguanylate cyclase (GGDEF)-like protein/PAS domain S-box-containing protein